MISYANTSMYQPGLNYNSYGNGLSTGFSMSNYTDTTSVFQGSNMNTGYYSQQCMAPQQQNSNESFMQQLVLLLVSNLLQRRQAEAHAHEEEETEINEEDTVAPAAAGGDDGPSDLETGVTVAAAIADPIGAVFGGW